MKGFYSLALFVAIAVTVSFAQTVLKPCVPVPECPLQNNLEYAVHVPYKEDPHKFYKCNGKCGYLMDCPLIEGSGERLVFNADLQVCDWPKDVPEGPDASKPITNCDIPRECPVRGTTKIAHNTDCHNYYLCANGDKLPLRCESGIFNPVTLTCDESGSAKCYVTGACDN